MRTRRVLGIVTAVLLLLSACGGGGAAARQGTRVASSVAEELARLTGKVARTELSPTEVEALAGRAAVSQEAVRAVAPALGSESRWQVVAGELRTIWRRYGEEITDVSLGVACDGLTGEIDSPEDAAESVAENVRGLTEPELTGLIQDTIELWQTLYEAGTTGTDQDKIAVELTCYTVQQS